MKAFEFRVQDIFQHDRITYNNHSVTLINMSDYNHIIQQNGPWFHPFPVVYEIQITWE